MAAVSSKYKKQIIWIIAVIVAVCGIAALSFWSRSNRVSCTITAGGERSSYRMNKLPEGDNNFSTSYWLESTGSIPIEGTAILEFEVPDDRETLVVEERYHHYISYDVGSTSLESYTLERNENGKFELQIGRKDQKKRYYPEAAVYVVTYKEKSYAIKVAFPALERTLDETYISRKCEFVSPLSATIPADDTGKTYRITDDVFYIWDVEKRASQKYDIIDWEWKEFPYTDEEWQKLRLDETDEYKISELYDEILYRKVSWNYCLLQLDGELWFVTLRQNSELGMYIWNIFSLQKEE